jgi:hypothetical protein
MKNVFMILFFLSGLAISGVSAQTCSPCPPGCCVASCCVAGKGSAAEASNTSGLATLAAFSPEAIQAACAGKNMTKKEIKACQTACQTACAAAPKDQSHAALQPASVHQTAFTTPSCQPACQTGKKGNSSSVSATPSTTFKVAQAKG